MIETVLIIILLALSVVFVYYANCDCKRLRMETNHRIQCMERSVRAFESIQKALETLTGKSCKDITYVEELRMYHSCVDCKFLAQCQDDSDLENVQFDYLVCEEFKEKEL